MVQCTGDLAKVIAIVGFVLNLIQWVVPIILIVLGTVDLVKAVIAGKEEEIKNNQKTLVKRIIAAIIIFLIPLIVSVITGLLGTDEWKECWNAHHNDGVGGLLDSTNDQ